MDTKSAPFALDSNRCLTPIAVKVSLSDTGRRDTIVR